MTMRADKPMSTTTADTARKLAEEWYDDWAKLVGGVTLRYKRVDFLVGKLLPLIELGDRMEERLHSLTGCGHDADWLAATGRKHHPSTPSTSGGTP